MNILVTNDDGINAPGLLALAQAMRQIGRVYILAPDRNWSASGHVKTLDRPLRVREVILEDGSRGFASDGAPSDCVALAASGFFDEKMDVLVSGINPYANLGHDVTYSGTVTAAMEAVIWGFPAVAVSLDQPDHYGGLVDFSTAALAARKIVLNVLREGLPAGVLLNVNVPFIEFDKAKGFQVTRQGLRVYRDRLDRRTDPRGKPYYWVLGDSPTGIPETGSDVGSVAAGYISITPLQLDLTAYGMMAALEKRNWQGNSQTARVDVEMAYK